MISGAGGSPRPQTRIIGPRTFGCSGLEGSVPSFVEEILKVRVILEPSDEGGYTAVVPSLPGCISEGDTKAEALANAEEAIRLYLEPVDDDLPLSPDAEVAEIAV